MPRLAVAIAAPILMLTTSAVGVVQASPPPVVEVRLRSFDFTPAVIRLHLGQPQVLRLVDDSGSHNFSAPALFAAARIDPASVRAVRRGTIEMHEGDVVEIRLTPMAAGRYPVRCTHLLHAAYGMKGEAVVG